MKKNTSHISGVGERCGAALFSHWDEFCRLRMLVLDRCDVESIHDLRVASRRLRTMAGLFAAYVGRKAAREFARELRRVTRKLGRLRNFDEAALYFQALPAPPAALIEMLRLARKQEMKAVATVLRSFPCAALDRAVREIVEALAVIPPDDSALQVYFSDSALQRYQAVYDLLLPAKVPENVEERHALRIAVKKWRYLLETLGQICRKDYSLTLADLKEYQTLLGSLNDLVEFGALCDACDLPGHERSIVKASLERDSGRFLACFMEMAASRPLQYTFSL